jgi:hypothetical protein
MIKETWNKIKNYVDHVQLEAAKKLYMELENYLDNRFERDIKKNLDKDKDAKKALYNSFKAARKASILQEMGINKKAAIE